MTEHNRRVNTKRKYSMFLLEKERPGSPDQGTRCPLPCGKMRYSSRKAAKKAARQIRSDGRHEVKTMHVYPCDLNGEFFHLTSWPADKLTEVRERRATANELSGHSTGCVELPGP